MSLRDLLLQVVLLFGFLVAKSWSSSDEDAIYAATSPLLREIEALKERLEMYEMKHDTLEAATEQFRLKAKSMKQKLEEERNRYDHLAVEKQSLETDFEERLQKMLRKETELFEKYKRDQEQNRLDLQEKIGQLQKQNEMSEQKHKSLQRDLLAKLEKGEDKYKLLEQKKLSEEEKMKKDVEMLVERLKDSEQQVSSLEQTLTATLADEKERDTLHQKELRMRIEEAKRWEARIKELNEEKKKLFFHLKQTETKLEASEDMGSKLQQKLTMTQNQLLAAEETLQEMTSEIQLKAEELSNIRSAIKDVQQKLDASEKYAKLLLEANNKTSAAYEDVIMQLESEREKSNQTAAMKTELQRTKKEYLSLEEELLFVKKQLNTTSLQSSDCSRTFETIRSEYDILHHNVTALRTKLDESNRELESCEETLENVQQERWQLMLVMEETKNRTISLQMMTTSKDEQIEKLSSKYVELETAALHYQKEFAELRSRFSKVAAELEVERKKSVAVGELAEQVEAKTTSCKTDLQMAKQRYEKVEEVALQHRKDLAVSTAQVAALLTELTETQQRLELVQSKTEMMANSTNPDNWMERTISTLRWIDYQLYQILRFVADSLVYIFDSSISHSNGSQAQIGSVSTVVHMVSSGDGVAQGWRISVRNTFVFFLNHGQVIVLLIEAIVALLLIDLTLSTILRHRSPTRRKMPPVVAGSEADCGSLLRIAKNFQK
ncbi:hypothetical protein IV203_000166 [Nitzschia inconspicua]|uniref:Uncharacterized protein n=1 Tax=Nitzschia inconspicua TaxID=303405 RepID=A0A9K3PPP5_9STRA|nr:hypothetical protein IV203_000166 [Nitzschia inconspicua]